MEKISEKSKLASFIHNFIFGWLQELGKSRPDIHSMEHVRQRIDPDDAIILHMEAFYKYCEPFGFNAKQTDRIYGAAFHWRKGANESVHIFQLTTKDVIRRVRWFEKQKDAAERAAIAAAVLKASAAAPIVLDLDTSTTDLPLIYWALKYEVDERFENDLAEIAHGK